MTQVACGLENRPMNRDLDEVRARFERRLKDLRQSTQRELGRSPRSSRWLMPLIAAAAGLAVAMGVRERRRRRLEQGVRKF